MPLVNALDQAGNIVNLQPLQANVSVATVSYTVPSNSSLPQLPGQTQATADAYGDISLANVVMVASPGEYNLMIGLSDYPEVPAAVVQIAVQSCGTGQIPSVDQNQCIECPSSTYSFSQQDSSCKACPAEATCTGGAVLVPQQQSWHSAANSDHIVACPNPNARQGNTAALLACQNATYSASLDVGQASPPPSCSLTESWHSFDPDSYMRQLCTEGYYGPVCSLCVRDGNISYGRTGTLQCKQCRPTGVIIAAYIGSALLVLVWLTYTIHVTLAENEEAAAGHNDPQKVSQLIRGFNLWLQYISLLGNLNLPTPNSIHWLFEVAGFAFASVTSGSLSADCLLTGPTNKALQRILIHLAVPVLMFTALCGIQGLWWWRGLKIKKSPSPIDSMQTAFAAGPQSAPPRSSQLRRRMLITLLEVLFYYYPSLLTTTLSLFACFHIDPSGSANSQYHNAQADWHSGYWVPDMSVECFGGWHRKLSIILGTPLMSLTWVIIPLMPTFLLFRHRHNLSAPQVQLQLGYIYRDYRPKLWFWNSIVLVLTLLLAAAQVFAIALDTYFQLTIMLLILILGVIAFAFFHPFTDGLMQGMQVLGLLTVVLTATGCLYFMDPNNVASSQGLEAVGALVMILNVGFVVLQLILIVVVGASQTKHYMCKAASLARAGFCKLRDRLRWLFEKVCSTRAGVTCKGMLGRVANTGAPSVAAVKAHPSGTSPDDSSVQSMGRGDSLHAQLFMTAPDSHLGSGRVPLGGVSHLDRFPSRSTVDSEVEMASV